MSVEYTEHEGVALLTLDNPPVNGLGHATRSGIVEGVSRAQADPAIRAIVITGAGRAFSGGADITEFNTPKATAEPMLGAVIQTLENSSKPVVAALHSVAMGGGLELALGAHYRVADGATQIALPEVKLGLLPGAGGTQRLPRAVGVELALRMIATGVALPARQLADTTLFDAIVERDVLGAALAFAREVSPQAGARAVAHPRLRDRALLDGQADPAALYEAARALARRTMKSQPAPLKCVDAIEFGVREGFDAGLRFERECFVALVATPESRALRHAFFAERAASKIAGVAGDTPTRDIAAVAVVGAGTMGRGIAMCFADAGVPVVLVETDAEALQHGFAAIDTLYRGQVAAGKLAAAEAERRLALIRPSLAYEDLAQADLIVEAVYEDAAVKQQVFEKLDAMVQPGAILASNTSTLDLNRIAGFTRRPGDVVGLHFFSPANVMKLLEVVRGAQTTPEVLASVMKLARKIGKTAVVSGVCDGFIGNRMIEQYLRQALFMLEEGATPRQVDRAIEAFGFAMGPFRMREARPSAEVDALVRAHAVASGIARRAIADEEIVERLLFALVNEGALILEEGIAARASDIDIVFLAGYGFPAGRGGPMFHADGLGLAYVRDAIRRFQAQPNGATWQVAPLLDRLAEAGGRFNR